MSSYLIVGAGVFGVSTAYHLKKQIPSASVTLIDRTDPPCPIAASHDINKIVRADYEDIFYCKLGLKTLHAWKTDPFFKQWFHPSGLLSVTDGNSLLIKKILQNLEKLDAKSEAEVFTPKEISQRFNGMFSDMRLKPDDKLLFNSSAGIAEAEKALGATIQACIDLGVRYVAAPVSRLIIQDNVCRGVEIEDGSRFSAPNIILSTGAATAKLLADSAPQQRELQVGPRITARGVCCAAVKLDDQQIKTFRKVPAVAHHAGGIQGETMPPVDGLLKFISDVSIKNTVFHPASGQHISVPFTDKTRSQWTTPEHIPRELRDDLNGVIKNIYGKKADGLRTTTMRLCWDGITPDDNWFICPHPRCTNLFVATAGSFHGWKFLPIVGEYVVQMLQGTLSEEMAQKWSWDRPLHSYPNPDRPDREWRNIKAGGASKL
ncbi:MAG: hypothetical protein Q9169_007429 [Polycauliona sp. 2 TL-2023]